MNMIIPRGSNRRFFVKIFINIIKNPALFFNRRTPRNLVKLFKIMYSEGPEGIKYCLSTYLKRNIVKNLQLNIMPLSGEHKNINDYKRIFIPRHHDIQVSIIIPVFNQFEYTYNCICSIVKNSEDVNYEIILGDDCSTDLTANIETIFPGINVVRNKSNLRFLKNCNNAATHAQGKYILFLNNDTQVQKNWLRPLIDVLEQDEKNGMVGSKLVYPDGRLQEAGGIVWRDGAAWNYGHNCDPNSPEYNYIKNVDYISGASIMIRKDLWKKIGGFDERFAPAYYEDTDLAFEVRKYGYNVLFQPLSVVVHFGGISNGTDTSSGQKSYQIKNKSIFYKKWKYILERDHYENENFIFTARERGRDKKYLLMIDHYVPTFDKDAGSRCVYQYIKLFTKLGYQVKFIGDNFSPIQPYTQILQQMGVEVLYGSFYANNWKEWLKKNGGNIYYAFLNRPHIAGRYIDDIRKYTPAKIAYFGHDLHFLRLQREYELTGEVQKLYDSKTLREQELSLMRKADVVYYPSVVEEDIIHDIDSSINVKAIPLNIFWNIHHTSYQPRERHDIMFIGGFGHTPNIDAVKWLANNILPRLVELLPNVVIHILGSNPPKEIELLENNHLKIEGSVTDDELVDFYHKCRLDIVPLRYGAGIKGKVVEAMRYGVPVVTTSIGAEGLSGAEKILVVEDDARVFAEKVAALYLDVDQLQRRSEESYQYVQKYFSPENVIRIIKDDFDIN